MPRPRSWLLALLLLPGLALAAERTTQQCGDEGVWVQFLGTGGPELTDGRASSAYIVWLDGRARALVDTGPGSSVAFDLSGARFEDLEVVLLTHLHVDHSGDFPAFIKGSYFADRSKPLVVLGPEGNDLMPSTTAFVEALIGPQGAYRYLADFLTWDSSGGYKVSPRDVPATGARRWARFGSDHLRVSAMPVDHGPVPALAWRIEVGDKAVVFSGDFSNEKDNLAKLARNANALVVTHAIPEGTRGTALQLHAEPNELGRVAARAGVRDLFLSHRMTRTYGRETPSRDAIEAHFEGNLIFADDNDCWGL